MIERAGGQPVLGCPGTPSVRVTWDQISEADPEVVVFMPCGYDATRAAGEAQAEGLHERQELAGADRFFAVDASAYFSRPGPRLVDGVEILAALLHPDVAALPHPDAVRQLR
jgi:iron complex transport system substrate-binding protein